MQNRNLSPLGSEFAKADLGNAARTKRLVRLANAMAAKPGESLPTQAPGDGGDLEGAYRFLENSKTDFRAVLDAHVAETVARISERANVFVVHDTTEFSFSGEKRRRNLGFLNDAKRQGFYAHYSIAVTPAGEPLGTLNIHSWIRPAPPKHKGVEGDRRRDPYKPDRESLRWGEAVLACAERAASSSDLVHLMDREGDCLELFALMLEYDQRFIVRLAYNRRLSAGREAEKSKLFERLSSAPLFFEREVVLSERGKANCAEKEKKFPTRLRRRAKLAVRAETLEIFPSHVVPANVPPSLRLNFVDIEEIDPPEGCEPVRWRLVTTEPIDTPENVAAIVDGYCMRWVVEEFFKTIKTCCRYEDRQLETAEALHIDLAIESAIAWRLLLIRWLSRAEPEAPATRVFSEPELAALRALVGPKKQLLPKDPTLRLAVDALAVAGGHIKNNGNPGTLVLRRGLAQLSIAVQVLSWANTIPKAINL